jgi:hypothetical protein
VHGLRVKTPFINVLVAKKSCPFFIIINFLKVLSFGLGSIIECVKIIFLIISLMM